MELYDIVSINPAPSGFGMYQTSGERTGDPVDLSEFLGDVRTCGDVCIIGKDELPDGVDDIRGRIYNQPDIVIAVVDYDSGLASYFGANAI